MGSSAVLVLEFKQGYSFVADSTFDDHCAAGQHARTLTYGTDVHASL
jgi:hypothetical protein